MREPYRGRHGPGYRDGEYIGDGVVTLPDGRKLRVRYVADSDVPVGDVRLTNERPRVEVQRSATERRTRFQMKNRFFDIADNVLHGMPMDETLSIVAAEMEKAIRAELAEDYAPLDYDHTAMLHSQLADAKKKLKFREQAQEAVEQENGNLRARLNNAQAAVKMLSGKTLAQQEEIEMRAKQNIELAAQIKHGPPPPSPEPDGPVSKIGHITETRHGIQIVCDAVGWWDEGID